MATTQDKDVAIWVCPHGTSADVVEFPKNSRPPANVACASHGEPLIKSCLRRGCPDPTYHPSDLTKNFHLCGERIPWAEMRAETAKALMEHDPYNPKYVGQPYKPDPWQADDLIRKRSQPYWGGEHVASKELTPGERQDTVTPPSLRRPVEDARPQKEPDIIVMDTRRPRPNDATQDLDVFVKPIRKVIEYTVTGAKAAEREERKLVRGILQFFGKSATKGAEEALAFIVKWSILGFVIFLLGLVGWLVVVRSLVPAL